jgi:L-ornithine N5-oxygenase
VDITGAEQEGDEVVLTVTEQMTGRQAELRCDVVLLGTGFEQGMTRLARTIADLAGVDELPVSRAYRAILPATVTAGCYLQGTNEESHGIADSLISVLAIRAGEIVDDILAAQPSDELLTSVPVPA